MAKEKELFENYKKQVKNYDFKIAMDHAKRLVFSTKYEKDKNCIYLLAQAFIDGTMYQYIRDNEIEII